MNLRKEIRRTLKRTLKEVRIRQEVNVKIEFVPDDAGSAGGFFIEEENHKGVGGATFDEAMKYFAILLKEMASNSL